MIHGLSHFTIAAADIENNILFYSKVIGLIHGETLKGAEPGAYFYIKGNLLPVVHVINQNLSRDKNTDFRLDANAVNQSPAMLTTGALDHIAFSLEISDFDAIEQRLKEHGFQYRVGNDLMPKMRQIWALDPNGIKVELNFLL